jgi:hypothetical protein
MVTSLLRLPSRFADFAEYSNLSPRMADCSPNRVIWQFPPAPVVAGGGALYIFGPLPPATPLDVHEVNCERQKRGPAWRFQRTIFQNRHRFLGNGQHTRRIVHLFVRVDDHGTVTDVSAPDQVYWQLTLIEIYSEWL